MKCALCKHNPTDYNTEKDLPRGLVVESYGRHQVCFECCKKVTIATSQHLFDKVFPSNK